MSESKGNEEHSLRELLGKIRHPLLEVRSRSLRSIVFKLNNELLSPADLVREREFLAALLEWFNFEEWAMEAQVLSLLAQLAEHEPAAMLLVEVGAVEFLSQLRLHCDPSLHSLIDEVLEQLLTLPQSSVPQTGGATPSNVMSQAVRPPPSDRAHLKGVHPSLSVVSSDDHLQGPLSRGTERPVAMPADTELSETSQQTFSTEATTDFGSYLDVNRESFGNYGLSAVSSFGTVQPGTYSGLPLQYLQRTDSLSTSTQSNLSSVSSSACASSQGSLNSHGGTVDSRAGLASTAGGMPSQKTRERPASFPYTGSVTTDSALQGDSLGTAQTEERTAPGGQFHWLRLSVNDCHILATTESRLQSSKGEALLRSCDFIQDVLLQDFPAEIFLQRPGVVKMLLQLVSETGPSEARVQLPMLHCLLELSSKLRERVAYSSNPSLGLADRIVPPPTKLERTDTDPCTAGLLLPGQLLSCHGDDQPLQGPKQELEEMTEEMLVQLQSQQLPLEQYCHCVLTHVPPLFIDYLNRDIQLPQGDGGREKEGGCSQSRSFHGALPKQVSVCFCLVSTTVELLESVRTNSSPSGGPRDQRLLYTGAQSMDSLTSALSQYLSKWRRVSSQPTATAGTSPQQLQLVCNTTVFLAFCLSSLLDSSCRAIPLPAATMSVLGDIMASGVIAVVCPELQSSLLPHLQKADASKSQLFRNTRLFSGAFQQMSRFLTTLKENRSAKELFPLAMESLPALYFFPNEDFITSAVKLCTERLTQGEGDEERGLAKNLLLKLLSHGSTEVKSVVYKYLETYITEGVARQKEEWQSSHPDSNILPIVLDGELLQEICCTGAVSEVEGVASAAGNILAALLSTREELFWPELRDKLLQWIVSIEASNSEPLQGALQNLLDESSEADGVPEVTRLQSLLRLLFSVDTEIRVWGLTSLSKLLLSKDDGKRSPFATKAAVSLQDVLVVGRPPPHHVYGKSTFQPDDVVKLLRILRSPTMDASLKKSALEQLAVLLHDFSLHGPAIAEGITTDLRTAFDAALWSYQTRAAAAHVAATNSSSGAQEGREKEEEEEEEEAVHLLRPCIQCLQLLVHSNGTLRRDLGCDKDFLMDAFRATLLCQKDLMVLYDASKLLACLLFTPIARFTAGGEGDVIMELPVALEKRLKFPFQVSSYTPDVTHSTPTPLDPRMVLSDPPLSMLRLCYHSAMAGGTENLLEGSYSWTEQPEMDVPASDIVTLRALTLSCYLSDSFVGLQNARSHDLVETQLSHLGLLLQASWRRHREMERLLKLGRFDWKLLFQRYLTVPPVTPEDTSLLADILEFLCFLVAGSSIGARGAYVGESQLAWLVDATAGSGAVCLQLLQTSLQTVEHSQPQRNLQKTLLKFYACLTRRIARGSLSPSLGLSDSLEPLESSCDPLTLTETLCHCLDVAGCPDYYDLPLLETSLECLQHLTASYLMRRPPSVEWLTQCMKLTTSLQQVLLSFISGRGELVASFMGKGVTSRASLSLCQLLNTTETLGPPEGWWAQWLQSASNIGPSWLQLLVQDREPQVRFAGLNLLASLSAVPSVIELLLTSWAGVGCFGLWGACLNIALDPGERELVRQQALFVLVNQSAVYTRSKKWEECLTCVTPEVTLHGSGALEELVETFSLLSSMRTIMHNPSFTFKQTMEQQEPSSSHMVSDTPFLLGCMRQKVPTSDSKEAEKSLLPTPVDTPDLAKPATKIFQCCHPLVVSGMCQLLHNLLLAFPEFIGAHLHSQSLVQTLIWFLDAEVFRIFLLAEKSGSISSCILSAWMRACNDVIGLLRAVVELRFEVAAPHLLREDGLASLCKILGHIQPLQTHNKDSLEVVSSIFALLQSVVERTPSAKAETVFSALQLHWSSFTGLVDLSLVNNSAIHLPLRRHGLKLLCSLLCHRFHPGKEGQAGRETKLAMEALRSLLDGRTGEEERFDGGVELERVRQREAETALQDSSPCAGSVLCEGLLKIYDSDTSIGVHGGSSVGKEDGGKGTQTAAEDKRLIVTALCMLLACSTAAKNRALACGLLESSLEQVKSLHTTLCLESLDEPSPTGRKKKESSLISQLISVLNLLRNFLYQSLAVKSAALECHLSSVAHKLWPWCTVERKLLLAVLKLLGVFTAQHSKGRTSLSSSTTKGGHTLTHSILKMASHVTGSYRSCSTAKATTNPHYEVLRATFSLLANSVLSSECRGIVKKVGFLSEFLKVNPKSEKPSHGQVGLSTMWAGFLTNLSFSTEGQQMIVKLSGSLDVLMDVHQSTGDKHTKVLSLLVLRNVCFYGPSKSLLASNEQFLHVLSDSLSSEDTKLIALAASAIQVLLHNCTKIKGCLRKSGLAEKLSHLDSVNKTTGTGSVSISGEPHQRVTTISRALALLQ